jgi:acylglycerol lipase
MTPGTSTLGAPAVKEERVTGVGGVQLLVRSWRPERAPRGIVAIVPGFNSHGGYYFWTAEQLVAAGFCVYAVDLRGRGLSDGERFYVESVGEYVHDVATLVTLAKSREPGLPLYLLGHSAGGVIACVYTLEHQGELAGLICESFAHQVPAPDIALAAIKGVSHVAPHAHVLKLKNQDFSRDPQVAQMMDEDPLIENETQPSQTVAEMVRADERLAREFRLITLPVFILHGTLDRVTKPSGSQFFFETAGSADKTLKLYEGHFHDLLNDVDRDVVMSDIVSWITRRLPA